MNSFFELYQTYVTGRDHVLGSTPLLSKYCAVVLEVKIDKPLYPLRRLYLSTAVLLLAKITACWIVHSNQVCGVLSYDIKKRYRRRSKRNVVRMHGMIREDMASPANPTWTGHQMVCNL